MDGDGNFEIKYWGKDSNGLYQEPKSGERSIKKKLAIVFLFMAVLAALPALIFGINSLKVKPDTKIVTTSEAKPEPTKATQTEDVEEAVEQDVTVINNDSYWKISKRVCGTGKYYLSIQAQNDSKPLYQKDKVSVNCVTL
ncbi:MAG: hypothetical protein HYW63_02785 [Candidatus Levybacteria bacterium]|nr:hypothetical protein [Candidatus Levybacteria bacterium]